MQGAGHPSVRVTEGRNKMDDHEGEKHLFRHRLYDLYHHCLYLDSLYHKTASRYGLWADIMSAFSIVVSVITLVAIYKDSYMMTWISIIVLCVTLFVNHILDLKGRSHSIVVLIAQVKDLQVECETLVHQTLICKPSKIKPCHIVLLNKMAEEIGKISAHDFSLLVLGPRYKRKKEAEETATQRAKTFFEQF